jgi:dihydroneopterin aldolase
MSKHYTVLVSDFVINGFVGIYPHEQAQQQPLLFNISVDMPLNSLQPEKIETTLNYELIVQLIQEQLQQKFLLLETLALNIKTTLESKFPLATNIVVQIQKTNPSITGFNGKVGVRF